MNPFEYIGTSEFPTVNLNKQENIFKISGRSLPEDVNKFYAPVQDWIKEYVKNPNPETEMEFNLEYFNSSSARIIVKLLVELEKIKLTGNKVHVKWYYKKNDEVMYDRGEEIKSVVHIPFDLIEV